jgi:hypothetical protein
MWSGIAIDRFRFQLDALAVNWNSMNIPAYCSEGSGSS